MPQAGKKISARLRAKAQQKLDSLGIKPAEYDAKLEEVIDCKSDEDRKMAKVLILAGAVVKKRGADYLKRAAEHQDVVNLLLLAGAQDNATVEKGQMAQPNHKTMPDDELVEHQVSERVRRRAENEEKSAEETESLVQASKKEARAAYAKAAALGVEREQMFVDAICAGFSSADSLAFAENLTNKVVDKEKKLELIMPEGWVYQGTLDVYENRGRVQLNRKMPDGSISKNCHWCHYPYDSGYLSKLRARIKGVQQSKMSPEEAYAKIAPAQEAYEKASPKKESAALAAWEKAIENYEFACMAAKVVNSQGAMYFPFREMHIEKMTVRYRQVPPGFFDGKVHENADEVKHFLIYQIGILFRSEGATASYDAETKTLEMTNSLNYHRVMKRALAVYASQSLPQRLSFKDYPELQLVSGKLKPNPKLYVFAVIPKQVIVDISAKLDVGNPVDNKLIRAEMKKVTTLMKKIQSRPGVQFIWLVEDNVTEKDLKASRVGLVRINAPRMITPANDKFMVSRLSQSGELCALVALPANEPAPFAYCDMLDSIEVKTLLSRIDDWLQHHAQNE